jgi:hypothetical protein
MKCLKNCRASRVACKDKDCRLWIDYKKDLNCTYEAISKFESGMTLREVAKRLDISFVRVKQIEDKAMKKLTKFANRMADE